MPVVNIPPFGSRRSIANPMVVAAATAAAFGVLDADALRTGYTGALAAGVPTVMIRLMRAVNKTSRPHAPKSRSDPDRQL